MLDYDLSDIVFEKKLNTEKSEDELENIKPRESRDKKKFNYNNNNNNTKRTEKSNDKEVETAAEAVF